MRVTVCQMSDDREYFAREWRRLVDHVKAEESELVLLNEFPFSTWFAESPTFDERTWKNAIAVHQAWLPRLEELAPAVVLGTCPIERDGQRFNEGFVWTQDRGYRAAHDKVYLPEEPGFHESSWYDRGEKQFRAIEAGEAVIGFTICTEVWFPEHARDYGQQGVNLIAAPRATANSKKWLVGGQAAAIIAGAYHLSSNRAGHTPSGTAFTGQGWIIDPDGEVIALTSDQQPFVTREVDLGLAAAARATYPRYLHNR